MESLKPTKSGAISVRRSVRLNPSSAHPAEGFMKLSHSITSECAGGKNQQSDSAKFLSSLPPKPVSIRLTRSKVRLCEKESSPAAAPKFVKSHKKSATDSTCRNTRHTKNASSTSGAPVPARKTRSCQRSKRPHQSEVVSEPKRHEPIAVATRSQRRKRKSESENLDVNIPTTTSKVSKKQKVTPNELDGTTKVNKKVQISQSKDSKAKSKSRPRRSSRLSQTKQTVPESQVSDTIQRSTHAAGTMVTPSPLIAQRAARLVDKSPPAFLASKNAAIDLESTKMSGSDSVSNWKPSYPRDPMPHNVVDIDRPCCEKRKDVYCGFCMNKDDNAAESLAEVYHTTYGEEHYGEMRFQEAQPHPTLLRVEYESDDDCVDIESGFDTEVSSIGNSSAGGDCKKWVANEMKRMQEATKKLKSAKKALEAQLNGKSRSAAALASLYIPPKISQSGLSKALQRCDQSHISHVSTDSLSTLEAQMDYMDRQPFLTSEMRAILVDWLIELAEEYNLQPKTLHMAVALVDRSLACVTGADAQNCNQCMTSTDNASYDDTSLLSKGGFVVNREMLQCVGCACMLMAAKLEEVKPPSADDFVYISDSSYTRQQIINMEMTICGVLSFHLQCVTPHQFLPRLLRASSASRLSLVPGKCFIRDEVLEVMVQYLLDLSLLSYDLVRQKPSLVAASAVYLARATLGRRENVKIPVTRPTYRQLNMPIRRNEGFWSDTLEYNTGFNVYDLEDTVLAIHELHSKAETSDLKSAFSIFRATKYKKIALRTVVPVHELGFP